MEYRRGGWVGYETVIYPWRGFSSQNHAKIPWPLGVNINPKNFAKKNKIDKHQKPQMNVLFINKK